MSKTNDGGPAFPSPGLPYATDERWDPRDGMTLRDYFAAKAMQVALADNTGGRMDHLAELSYDMADAMIAARSS